ncbi:MAG: DUF3566 domain-containing protein [Actinomycetota bacterium]|nr:DUF3566 domain-containing protein [Actinomycetota bacterium]
MDIERRVLKSVSELSMFKYLLFFYLIFFLLWIIVMVFVGLLTWFGLSSYGLDINNILQSFGMGNTNVLPGLLGGGTALAIVMVIVGGLLTAVFSAGVGTIMVWIMNVVLKMSGGIELRFLPEKKK